MPYPMARDIAKKTTKKIKSQVKSSKGKPSSIRKKQSNKKLHVTPSTRIKPVVVTATQVRNLVTQELRQRNRPEIAKSYTGNPPEYLNFESKPSLDEKEPALKQYKKK